MSDRKMMAHVLDCLKDLVIEFNLDIIKSIDKHGFNLEFENENDWLSISYATHHPYDYPFFFNAVYCKQKFINKDALLYRSGTKEITPLWKFDNKLNINITGGIDDIPIVTECCEKAVEMFSYYQAMSDDEYLNEVISK